MRKKYAVILTFAIAVLVTPLALIGAAHATGFRGGNTITVNKSETVDGTLFAAGQTINIAGVVNGDIFCAGNNVTITGIVHGDVICAGRTVDVRGVVDGDIRVAGETVSIEAKVAGNASVAGQTVLLQSGAEVWDFHGAGATISLAGIVARDADIAGSSLTVDGPIGRNVSAAGETVALGTNAKIAGNLDYTSRDGVSKANGALVNGQTKHTIPNDNQNGQASAKHFLAGINWFFALAGLLTSLVLVALLPRVFYSVTTHGVSQPGMTLLAGLGTNVGAVIVMILLAMTVIGLPLAGLVLLTWILVLMLSIPVFSFYVGRVLLSNTTNNMFYYMLLGSVIVFLLNFIPVLGGIVLFLGSWFGVGMLALRVSRHWVAPRYTINQSKKA